MQLAAGARFCDVRFGARILLTGPLLLLLGGCGAVEQSPDNAQLLASAIEVSGPFCLSTEFQPQGIQDDTIPTVLTRELARQAVLIAARDGLGLATRDETLDETFPVDEKSRRGPYSLTIRNQTEDVLRLDLQVPGVMAGSAPLRFFELDLKVESDVGKLYTSQAKELAAAARSEFVQQLRSAGFEGQSVKSDSEGMPPEETTAKLLEMNFVAQFSAVRCLHADIAEKGESPARLGGLVIGYANLSLLVRHHWTSGYAAFSARSLLYAERLMTISNNSAPAYQHRAYARALAGLPVAALADLAQEAVAQDDSPPEWVSILQSYCRFEREKLLAHGEAPALRPLVNLLAFQLNSCYDNERWNVAAGKIAVKACPDAYGIYSELANHTPMLVQRQSVAAAAEAIGRNIPAHVARIDGLPKPVLELVKDELQPSSSWLSRFMRGDRASKAWSPLPHQVAIGLRQHCQASDDVGEPSWTALAALIDDEQFVAITNYLMVSMNAVEYSKEELVNQLAPLVEGWPYEPYVRSFALSRGRPQSELAEFASAVLVRDPRPPMHKMLTKFWNFSDANGQTYCNLYNHSLWTADRTLPAMVAAINDISDTWWKNASALGEVRPWMGDLQAVAPDAPTALRLEIQISGQPDLEQISAWEERAAGDPLALARIGQMYHDQGEFEGAIRSFDRSYLLSPAYKTAISLADAYRAAGKEDQWLPALEAYLEEEDYSLGHALVHQKIAEDLIRNKKWAEAEPHALEAANTWSAWGLTLAGKVCEGLGKWDESEKWYREAATSYPTYSGYEWYFWCCRTGRGDKESARKAFDEFLKLEWVQNRAQGENYPLVENVLAGRNQEVLDEIQARSEYAGDEYWQLHAALMAKRVGNEVLYSEILDTTNNLVQEKYKDSDRNFCNLFEFIQQLQREGKLSDDQIGALDKLFAEFGPVATANYCYFLGEQLALHGDAANAQKYWRQSLESGQFQKYNATFSGHRLAELQGTSRPDTGTKSTSAKTDEIDEVESAQQSGNSL